MLTLQEHFADLEDPRVNRTKRHPPSAIEPAVTIDLEHNK